MLLCVNDVVYENLSNSLMRSFPLGNSTTFLEYTGFSKLDLPEEIIEKILSYLDVESLKAAALTCRTLNETSSKMGWKLKLTFKNKMKEEPWVDVLLESNRKFNSIRLCEYAEMRNIRLMNFFEKHGRNLQKLVIDGGEFHSFKIFCDVLSSMPNLKKISFRNSDTR
ncbi:CLUMA_CG013048, isoform A, partial [Clunio marinus]